jgi:hypothetical protein
MNIKKKLKGLCLVLTLTISLQAQVASTTCGGEGTGDGGSLSYTVGLVSYSSGSANNESITEGIQQPWEVYTVTGINTNEINLNILTYPNPVNSVLQLMVEEEKYEGLIFQLFDLDGKLLKYDKIVNSQTQIDLDGLPASTYLIKIIQNNNPIKTFKIIKN